MPSVVLIGDSIRMGYQPFVQRELAGAADVWGPQENGGTSANVLAHLDEWVIDRQPDLVHVNAGLHDLRTQDHNSPESVIPLPRYREHVTEILRRLTTGAEAVVIWATTTPVNEEHHHRAKDFDRRNEDVLACNAAAVEIAAGLGVAVNDLYSVVPDGPESKWLTDDGVHFTADGSEALGAAVARVISTHF